MECEAMRCFMIYFTGSIMTASSWFLVCYYSDSKTTIGDALKGLIFSLVSWVGLMAILIVTVCVLINRLIESRILKRNLFKTRH